MKKCVFLSLASALIAAASNNFKTVTDPTCGVVGDGKIDDTTALNHCIATLPDYGVLAFEAGLSIRISSTIKIHGKYGIRLLGLTSMFGGPSIGKAAPALYWNGPDGGAMVDINNSQNFVIEGLTLFSAPNFTTGTGGAHIGFNVDQTLKLGLITTNGIFERVTVEGMEQNSHFIGIAFALAGGSNVEHMTVRDSIVSCSYGTGYANAVGQGITIGGSYNAKKHLYENNSITNCATGIYIANGSADIFHNQFNQNGTHIFAVPVDPIVIEANDSENARQFFRGNLSYGGTIRGNRIAAVFPPKGSCAVEIDGGSTVMFEANGFDRGAYVPVCRGPSGAGALASKGNSYPNMTETLAGFRTFDYGLTSELDGIPGLGGYAALATSGSHFSEDKPTTGMGFIYYAKDAQAWQISENGQPYTHLGAGLPFRTPKSAKDSCKKGDMFEDASYIYVCVADNTVKRTPLSSF